MVPIDIIKRTFVKRSATSERSYYDIAFKLDPSAVSLAYLQFQNYFTASIVIDQMLESSPMVWRTVLPRRALMRDPHSEEDAQAWQVVSASDFDAPTWHTAVGQPQVLRIYIEQPSPAWRQYELRGLTLWGCELPPAAAAAPTANDPADAALRRLLHAQIRLRRCFERVASLRRAREAIALPSDDFVRHHLVET
jgi:hypothetical protein|tara:strand:- start:1285 stop:1866 length:582 start_codon:yes stop_codon:yes gene_type:complete